MPSRDRLPPIHPGEILREEFLAPLGMSAHELALALRVPATRINDIVNEKRAMGRPGFQSFGGALPRLPARCYASSGTLPNQ